MNNTTPAIEFENLTRRYGKLDAVNGLSLKVQPGRCYGFFGRNGAGKTTSIKCLLNLLRPTSGAARVFGLNPQKDEVAVKSRLCYVPDAVAFYPWMSVRETLDYLASFRAHWNRKIEQELFERFQLDPATNGLSSNWFESALAGKIGLPGSTDEAKVSPPSLNRMIIPSVRKGR